MRVLRISNPAALALAEMQELLQAAFASGRPVDAATALRGLEPLLGRPQLAFLVAFDDEFKPRGLAIVTFPTTPLAPAPQVYHFYFKGPAKLRQLLVDAVVEVTTEMGYNRFQAANWNVGQDAAFKRLFRRAGKAKELGTAFEFEVGK